MTQYDDNNIFAKILRGEIPNNTVFENEHVLAFRDIAPQAPVHILVIPKNAYISAEDFGDKASDLEIAAVHRAISDIVKQENLSSDGFRIIANTGDHGGQEVPHLHYHILGGESLGPMLSR
jgi:histidine triad (HIT) family protein